MLDETQLERFHRDGFLNAGTVFRDDEVDALAAELDRVLAIGPTGFGPGEPQPVLFRDLTGQATDNPYGNSEDGVNPVWQIVNIWEASPAFERLLYHPLIVATVSQLTGFADLQVWHDQIQYKPAGDGGATAWHQDAPLWPSIDPMTPVSAWIPFDDADVDNGCMWMVPGSHRWGNQMEYLRTQGHRQRLPEFSSFDVEFLPAEARAAAPPQACPVRRGEVHFHHSLTWHGSPFNESPRPRRAIAIHYMTSDATYTGHAHPMSQFIDIASGEAMRDAGPHFPAVCRGGAPLPAPA